MKRRFEPRQGCWAVDRASRAVFLAGALVASSGIMAAASETASLSWIAWISLLPVFITIRVASPRLALFYGGLWGLCLYFFSSLTSDIAANSGIHVIGLLSAVPAIYVYMGARLTRRIGYAPLILAVGWMLVELALQPASFHHGLLAGAVGEGGLMRLIGGVLGYTFVAFLIAFVNAQLVSLVSNIDISICHALPKIDICRLCGWVINGSVDCDNTIIDSTSQPRAPPCSGPAANCL